MAENDRAAEAQQTDVLELLNQGADLLQRGEGRKAISPLEEARSLAPDNVPVLINLGGAYILAGRHREAVAPLELARDYEPDNAMIWTNLGAAYLGNPVLATDEQQKRAIRAFERAIELNPAAPNVHYNLGLIFLDRGAAELAEAAFRRALQVNPFDRDARHWLQKLGAADEEEKDG